MGRGTTPLPEASRALGSLGVHVGFEIWGSAEQRYGQRRTGEILRLQDSKILQLPDPGWSPIPPPWRWC
jgi:hypothetical protein